MVSNSMGWVVGVSSKQPGSGMYYVVEYPLQIGDKLLIHSLNCRELAMQCV